ncbi:rRNA biogenesis protein RRP5 [Amborella trichopoda]|nr:rRNA biogenesis protein RRP5 [Amborella trichopoda]|eukprot:XP_020532096.1 rRNA biogenesis protein RRP5 [Amborella trichopoda]
MKKTSPMTRKARPLEKKEKKKASLKRKVEEVGHAKPYSIFSQEDVPDFPRGGASVLSRSELEEARASADAQFEVEARVSKKAKRPRKPFTSEEDLGSLFGDGSSSTLPRFANRITPKNVSVGMKIWGIISEVNAKDLLVSLPGGLKGFVKVEEASDLFLEKGGSLEKTRGSSSKENNVLECNFYVGQLVPCVVIGVAHDDKREAKGSKRIWLSLRLSLLHKGLALDSIHDGMVLMACVRSVEDHGYILHFGISCFTGFMPRSSKIDDADAMMNRGHLLQGVVSSVDRVRGVVHLSSDPDLVANGLAKDPKGLSIDMLVPGMMVNARVQSMLENGILLSFLTYFTGTVDIFNMQIQFPSATWKDDFDHSMRVRARLLFIDPTTRAVGLTLNPHLIRNKAPPVYVKAGDIFESSRVVRVDRRFGLLLEIPSSPDPTPGYVNIFDASDKEALKLEKKLKVGSNVRARVLGIRPLEGLVMCTLKASAFEGSVFAHSDVKPGMFVKGKIIAVETFGAIVQFSNGIKALCPLQHMSEFELVKPFKKFEVGAELTFRVLGCKSKRITVTHKKTLVKSKLGVLSSYVNAAVGLITHGWITKIEKHGCFVRFYNGVQGFAHRSELALDLGSEVDSTYHVGQVVKCRVINAIPGARKINLSFVLSPKRASVTDHAIKCGSIISGVVEHVTANAVMVYVGTNAYMKGKIITEHLADNRDQAELLKSLLTPGYEFKELLVLDMDGNHLFLSAKYSLVKSVEQLPSDIDQVVPQSVLHGYVCNLIETGCFVRYLGRLTGFAPKGKIVDDRTIGLSDVLYIGQSVRSHVLNVDGDTGRISLSLKQSSCFSTNVSLIQGYFVMEEQIAKLQSIRSKVSDLKWICSCKISSFIKGEIQEIKDYGVVVRLLQADPAVGFITPYQLGGTTVHTGSVVEALVLDIGMGEGIVDLSLREELLVGHKREGLEGSLSSKKRRRDECFNLELHQNVNAVVEMVKENYLVLTLPEHGHAIGYSSTSDYNTKKLPHKFFVNGQRLVATIEALPEASGAGRLLLLLKCLSEVVVSSSLKRALKKSGYNVGSLVEAEITGIRPLEMRLKFGKGLHGRIHITEVYDAGHVELKPFSNYRIGEHLTARIFEKATKSDVSSKQHIWELSIKPSMLAGSAEVADGHLVEDFDYSLGEMITCYVVKVDNEWLRLAVSCSIMGHMFVLDTSAEPSELEEFPKRFSVGQGISCFIIGIDRGKKVLRLSLHAISAKHGARHDVDDIVQPDDIGSTSSNEKASEFIHEGDFLGGRISKILPGVGGLHVQIGPHLYGKVHYTEVTEHFVPEPLSQYQEGQFVRCRVLNVDRTTKGNLHVDLSLWTPSEGTQLVSSEGHESLQEKFSKVRVEKIADLHPMMDIEGYVKSITSKGCFVMLSRHLDARILLSNLSDRYIEDPEKEFPVGKLVHGKVISVEPLSKRIDVTLKSKIGTGVSDSSVLDFESLHVGDVISGRIRRVESYGLFINIDHTNLVGLCHISELSDNHVEHIDSKYAVGQRVQAKVLKIDQERNRVSLGLKESYLGVKTNQIFTNFEMLEEVINGHGSSDDLETHTETDGFKNSPQDSARVRSFDMKSDFLILTDIKSRESVLPLEVDFGDTEDRYFGDAESGAKENSKEKKIADSSSTEKKSRRAKKKAKEEREMEIRAAEENLLDDLCPNSVDDFEKMVRGSPNSSLVWIKYMDFMLSLADVENARSIAERALNAIDIREEAEKLNVWVAYFNLENTHGKPPEEAVRKIFERALQYCDPEKLHLALLGMYERTEQYQLADELLNKMVKKFKSSCEVWLRRVENLLKQGKDDVQDILRRGLQSLPRHQHIEFISKTALLEFKCGEPERGRSLFEELLRNHPKRTDLWSVYLDQEIRIGDSELIRALFERATCLTLPPKKMKFLFKKYLTYEKSHGDESRVEYVMKKAMEFVNSTLG